MDRVRKRTARSVHVADVPLPVSRLLVCILWAFLLFQAPAVLWARPTTTILLHITLDDNEAITNPAVGLEGVSDELIIRATPRPPDTDSLTATGSPTATTTPVGPGITDPDQAVTPAPLPRPSPGIPFTDPAFGTTLRRVSNAGEHGGFETHEYSQLQAFSLDNAYLLLVTNQGYLVRRLSDFSPVSGLDTRGWNAARWFSPQPHTLIHFDDNADTILRLQLTSAETLTTTTIFTFPAPYQRIIPNRSSDELSRDGRWLAGIASRSDGEWVAFAMDVQNRVLGTQLPITDLYMPAGPCARDPQWGAIPPDWVGVSPLGNYLVVQWERDGITRCSGLETFDLISGEFIGRPYDGHQHGDLGVDRDGETEFFMTFELAAPPPNNNFPAMGLRTLPGADTVSQPTYLQVTGWFQEHVSCQGPYGVCLITTTVDEDPEWSPLESELFLQYTDGAIRRLAHHRSSSCGYWVQPRSSISRDGRYVAFASDWGQETGTDSCNGGNELGAGDVYVIDLGATQLPEITPDEENTLYLPLIIIAPTAIPHG